MTLDGDFCVTLLTKWENFETGKNTKIKYLLFIQVETVQFVRGQLQLAVLSSEIQPFSCQKPGPELQRSAGFSSEGAE